LKGVAAPGTFNTAGSAGLPLAAGRRTPATGAGRRRGEHDLIRAVPVRKDAPYEIADPRSTLKEVKGSLAARGVITLML